MVLGIISALTGIFVIGSFLTIPTIVFAVIALVMVKNGTGKGKGMAIAALVLVLVAYIATFAFFQIRAANLEKSNREAREVIQKCENNEPGYYIIEKDGKRYCNAGGWVYEMDK
ncbi:DUF4190 domain-containing protein [Rothia mucilaginosa]